VATSIRVVFCILNIFERVYMIVKTILCSFLYYCWLKQC